MAKTYLYHTAYTHSLKAELPRVGSCLVRTKGESKSLQRILIQMGFKWTGMSGYYHPLTLVTGKTDTYYVCWDRHVVYSKEYNMTWTVDSFRAKQQIKFEDYFKPLKRFRGLNLKRFGI